MFYKVVPSVFFLFGNLKKKKKTANFAVHWCGFHRKLPIRSFLRMMLKGNRVKIPGSPAAVSSVVCRHNRPLVLSVLGRRIAWNKPEYLPLP